MADGSTTGKVIPPEAAGAGDEEADRAIREPAALGEHWETGREQTNKRELHCIRTQVYILSYVNFVDTIENVIQEE